VLSPVAAPPAALRRAARRARSAGSHHPLRYEPALGGIGQDRLHDGQQVLGARHVVQVDDAPGRERLADAGNAGSLRLVHQQEPEARHQRCGDERDELQVARPGPLRGLRGRSPLGGGTVGHPHRP
jgi:hypothetical protein